MILNIPKICDSKTDSPLIVNHSDRTTENSNPPFPTITNDESFSIQ